MSSRIYDIASIILAEALECLPSQGDCGVFRSYVSAGRPAYDCNQLTIYLVPSRARVDNLCVANLDLMFEISFVRGCVPTGDGGPPSPEDLDRFAQCFLTDVHTLWECLSCSRGDLADALGVNDCDGIGFTSIEPDLQASGTFYAARFGVSVPIFACCQS